VFGPFASLLIHETAKRWQSRSEDLPSPDYPFLAASSSLAMRSVPGEDHFVAAWEIVQFLAAWWRLRGLTANANWR
jgi:hypothetical protein